MELGRKILQARLEAGMSQRQLCGEEITRNMLSLIEHGNAKPSMKTLAYLSRRLGKPMAYFLEEDAVDQSELAESAEALRRAEEAADAGKDIYAAQLLEQVTASRLLREKLLLQSRLPGADLQEICRELPSLDEELLLRAEAALEAGEPGRCRRLLAAVENQETPRWNLMAGKFCMARSEWARGAEYLLKAEADYPDAAGLLEQCFRELGDFRRAYEYACKQKR